MSTSEASAGAWDSAVEEPWLSEPLSGAELLEVPLLHPASAPAASKPASRTPNAFFCFHMYSSLKI
jgi:hypothetical protein